MASAREDMGISARVKDRAARQQAWQGWSPSLAPGGCKFVLWSPAVEQMQPPVLALGQRGGGSPVGEEGELPGGLVKEHDRWVVDQLQGNGQALLLPTGE